MTNLLQRISNRIRLDTSASLKQFSRVLFPSCCIACNSELGMSGDRFSQQSNEPINSGNEQSSYPDCAAFPDSQKIWFNQWRTNHWCEPCWKNLTAQGKFKCPRCGARLLKPSPFANACSYCRVHKLRFDRAVAVGNYEGQLRELVTRMKNQKDDALAIQLGNLLAIQLVVQCLTQFDQLVPVPIHWTRRLKRGFQATEILVDRVAQTTGIPQNQNLVIPTRATAKQGTLSSSARATNVRNAFKVSSFSKIEGQRILLIDDVLTTGATSSEIAKMLKKSGAAEVCVAVIARATGIG